MTEKIKYTRKDLKGPDEFVSTFSRLVSWVKENRLRVGMAAAVAFLIAGGVLGSRAYFAWEEEKATSDLWPHLNRAREFLQAPAAADAQKLAGLEQFLAAHVNRHPDTRTAVYARYYLGSIAYLRGNYDLAAAQFQAALASGKAKDLFIFLLREGLAQSLEAKGDFAGAARAYREAAASAGPEMKTLAMSGEARTLEFQGKRREAADVYRKILVEDPGTPLKEFVEIKLQQLG
ncbi:MAG: tetratricopeptide repeat protein [Deltaproteobacteria bacterium]|nr:tetratricopeptide repeat protein [Deltaproteobacteria bacterium]